MAKQPSSSPPSTPGVGRAPAPAAPAAPAAAPAAPSLSTAAGLTRYLGFRPNDRQYEVRSAFWAFVREQGAALDIESLTPAKVKDLLRADCTGLDAWWKDPDFRTWFLGGNNEWRGKVELAIHLALDATIERLRDGEASLKDLQAALKQLGDLGDFFPKRWVKERFVDAEVAKKSPEELEKELADFMLGKGWTPPSSPSALPKAEDSN